MIAAALALILSVAFAGTPPATYEPPSGSPEEHVKRGMQLLAGGDIDGAISRFAKAQADRPNSPEIDINLGLAYFRKGELDKAAERFSAAAAKEGGKLRAVANYNLGNTRVRQGRFEEAISAYREALRAAPEMEEARYNLELIERHLKNLKELEEQRRKAEEEFKRKLEELTRRLASLVEGQTQTLKGIWAIAQPTEPEASEEELESYRELTLQKKPIPDGLAAKLARAFAAQSNVPAAAKGLPELAALEQELASGAREVAEVAANLAADLKQATGHHAQKDSKEAHPLIGALERAGGLCEEASKAVSSAGELLSAGSPAGAEPNAAVGLWKLVQALGELVSPKGSSGRALAEELEKLLRRMADIRSMQAGVIRDLWASFPDSRGELPGPEDQKAFWEAVRAGMPPDEDKRAAMARLEIMAGGTGRSGCAASELAEVERHLAAEARALASEFDALLASAPAGGAGGLANMGQALRDASDLMEAAAEHLSAGSPRTREAERAGVSAFIKLSREPTQLDELLARLGQLLAEQTKSLLDTWKTDPSSRGSEPSPEEMSDSTAPASPELEAKLGRLFAANVDKASGGRVGRPVSGEEAAAAQKGLASRAKELSADARRLAASGSRPGEQNPAAQLLEQSASDVDESAARMEDAVLAFTRSFAEAEPHQARAVAALMRALSRFASGAAGELGKQPQQQEERGQEETSSEASEKGDTAETQREERPAESKKPEKDKPVSKERASTLLDEISQEERELRRDMRRLRGTRPVEVKRDW